MIHFSLIIATLHDDGDLTICLDSLTKLNKEPCFEVIIIDQNNDDRLIEVIQRYVNQINIQHHQVTFKAASRARNLGAKLARGKWVGFPDDDCQFMPDTLIEIEQLTSQSQISVITGQTVDELGSPNLVRWRQEPTFFTRWTMFGCLVEATMYVRRDLFLKAQGFDERFGPGALFPAAEGIELMNRLFSEIGSGQACYTPKVRLIHPTKIPPWNRWAADRLYSYALGEGALIAKSPQPHILYWGARAFLATTRQMFAFRGWRSAAFSARLMGLFKGFFKGMMVFYFRSTRH